MQMGQEQRIGELTVGTREIVLLGDRLLEKLRATRLEPAVIWRVDCAPWM